MTDFLATLSPKFPGNWDICKREGLWGVVGRGTNWRKNASKVAPTDRVFIWRSGKKNGIIAQIEALGPFELAAPGLSLPWPEPDWFGGVFRMRVVSELTHPAGDSFPNANGRVGSRFGFNNSALQHIFEEISPFIAGRIAAVFPGAPTPTLPVGVPYLPPPAPSPTAHSDPFERDPDLVDRGLLAHHVTVERLARWVSSNGFDPRLPGLKDPQFDLAWQDGPTIIVAEVKSITVTNEEKQLRLGLGQVLRYRHQLGGSGVKAWLVPEREPSDPSWAATCVANDVALLWPDALP